MEPRKIPSSKKGGSRLVADFKFPMGHLSHQEIVEYCVALAKDCKMSTPWIVNRQLSDILFFAQRATTLIKNTERFSGGAEDNSWKICSEFTYDNLEGISLLDTAAKIIRNLKECEKCDKELCETAARQLERLDYMWQLKFNLSEDCAFDKTFFQVKAYYWRPGSERCLTKTLKVLRPLEPDPVKIFLMITITMICKIQEVCNELQAFYNSEMAPNDNFQGPEQETGGLTLKQIQEWVDTGFIKH